MAHKQNITTSTSPVFCNRPIYKHTLLLISTYMFDYLMLWSVSNDKINCNGLNKHIQAKLQCSICSCILRGYIIMTARSIILTAYHVLNH